MKKGSSHHDKHTRRTSAIRKSAVAAEPSERAAIEWVQTAPERSQTNGSLRTERARADEEIGRAENRSAVHAEGVVQRARETVDDTLETARKAAAAKLEGTGFSLEAVALVKAQQAFEEAILALERRSEDRQIDIERKKRQDFQDSALNRERAQTDESLQQERARLDGSFERIIVELAESIRLRDEFISMVSHELRTPLTPIALRLQSMSQDAARQPESPFKERLTRYLDVANGRLKHLTSLISDLLDVSRITAGQLSLEPKTVDFGAVVEAAVQGQQARAAKVGPPIEVDASSVVGQWDEDRLGRAVTCLLDNAIKYGLGKPIRVRLRSTPEKAVLTVQDEGVGIAPEHLSRIFGRFERTVSNDQYSGLGLGLYLCRSVVEAMGGSVSVQSELHQGTTFTVELPLTSPIS